jgi:Baseplate J-like protein
MNVDTFTLLQRTFPELIDDLVTAIAGGVINEQISFDLKQARYPLSQPAAEVRSIKGNIAGPDDNPLPQVYVFQPNVDYAFSASDSTVAWLPKGQHPADDTTFYVDYFRPATAIAPSPLTDINVGSVTRTLTEAIGREIATVFQEIYNAYRAGFVGTAQGTSLDYVVSILGVVRKGAEYATGLATFLRDPAIDGDITIPDLTQVATADGKVFETTELRTMQRGQQRLDVPIRATGAAAGPLGVVAAGQIVSIGTPVAGISSVTNVDATVLGAAPETDDQLRARAKATLRGLGQATLSALARAVFDERSQLLDVKDPNGPPGKTSPPGTVSLLVSTEEARYGGLNDSVQQTRAAGVLATVVARFVYITPRIAVTLSPSLPPSGTLKLVGQLIGALQGYVDSLPAGEPADGQAMLAAIATVPELKAANPRFLDILAARANIDNPGSQPLVDALVTAVQAAPGRDAASLTTAITNVVTSDIAPLFSEGRTADRGLITGKSGAATDDDIEAGTFKVVPPPPADGQKWAIALDMNPSDVQISGGSS